MQTTEAQQLLLEILNNVTEGKSIEFHYIRSWREFNYYRQQLRATKLIIKVLRTSSKKLFKKYCKDVIAGIPGVNKILAYVKLTEAIDFYRRDLDILKQMLDEYDNYLGEGNFWHSLLGGQRMI